MRLPARRASPGPRGVAAAALHHPTPLALQLRRLPLLPSRAAFKQQNAVHGLPLELSPEEVTLALERGWGALQAPLHTAALAAALGADAGRKRGRGQPSAYQYYAEDEEEEDAYMEDLPMAQQPAVEPTWRAALTGSTGFTLPSTPEEAAAANAGQPWPAPAAAAAVAPAGGADAQAAAAAEGANAQPAAAPDGAAAQPAAAAAAADEGGGAPPLEWSWPGTEAERHRYWVFRDLHAKGCAAALAVLCMLRCTGGMNESAPCPGLPVGCAQRCAPLHARLP